LFIFSVNIFATSCVISCSGKELEEWGLSGVRYIQNGRTKQNLPQYFSLFEDFSENQEKLSIEKACENLKYQR
jgi:hypothetical protein